MLTAFDSNLLQIISEGLATVGYALIDEALPPTIVADLLSQIKAIDVNQFNTAGIGRAAGFQTNSQIRSDQILWLDENRAMNQNYLNWAEGLRLALNQQFYMGLSEYECMFAHYPVGAFYQKHVDVFKPVGNSRSRSSNRKISTILYLNPNWQPDDGGELLLYRDDQTQPFKRILPELGKLVVFLSEDFPHEVLPAKKSRYSLTGWFRV
ncbi:SM-20-related protein [hydrothermal vent metagenome]|uniref:SM-20-related protein n=1 Tax=hydrothermal vent metagenome TaxID=652676 RepID=A0A3B0VKE3_9ZZZZ